MFEEMIQPGATWSHVLKRGTSLRVTDLEGGANVGAIFYNYENPSELYNMPDTLKAQHIAHLTRGQAWINVNKRFKPWKPASSGQSHTS